MTFTLTPVKYGPPAQTMVLADSVQLDSFGRLRVSEPTTIFDAQQEYGLNTLQTWDAAVYNGSATLSYPTAAISGSVSSGGNAVGPRNANNRMTPVTVSTQSGDYAILQSRQYTRYIPGKGHLVFITGVFAPNSDYVAKITMRTKTSGGVVDTKVDQLSWNIDTFNGIGPSGITLDFTKTQILVIQAQWLGVGRVVVGFDVDGVIYPAHVFKHANRLSLPYTQSFNLPVRMEARNLSGSTISRVGYFDSENGVYLETDSETSGGTVYLVCCSVQSEGGSVVKGFPFSASNGITAKSVTTRRPILSIRNAATLGSITNRSHIELYEIALSASTNAAFWEIVQGGNLTGASWAAVNANSSAERDIAASAISGGIVLASGFATAGTGVLRNLTTFSPDIRNPLTISKIDALTETQVPISLVCTSFTGTSSVTGAMNWYEQTG